MFEAKTLMKTKLITVKQDSSIYEAIRLLVNKNITGLPVVDDEGVLVGIVSEKDMLRLLYNIKDKAGSVQEFMTKSVVCFTEDDSLIDIAESFIDNHFRRVPIVRDNKLVGIISRRDIVEYILKLRRKDKVAV